MGKEKRGRKVRSEDVKLVPKRKRSGKVVMSTVRVRHSPSVCSTNGTPVVISPRARPVQSQIPELEALDLVLSETHPSEDAAECTRKRGVSQNDLLRSWKNVEERYLHEILSLEGYGSNHNCQACSTDLGIIRCKECFGCPKFCHRCCLSVHQHAPFHHIEKWDSGGFFVETSLYNEGFVLYLGHGGVPCPAMVTQTMQEQFIPEVSLDKVMEEEDAGLSGQWEDVERSKASVTMTIVDCNGVHHHHVQWCQCPGAANHDIQLLHERLFPASVTNPSSALTFQVLEYFHIDAMECKTSAMNFFSKIRRLTNYTSPASVPDRYRELMRLSRMWRYLKSKIRAGFGHDPRAQVKAGDLALFCPACPQPGINLAENWKDDENQWLYRRSIVMDGNFSAEHMKMRNPGDDVSLTYGSGYMVNFSDYEAHLQTAIEIREKSKCHNHKAVNRTNTGNKNLEATGIGAVACARHGCFYKSCVCDFQLGEKQMNMDYALCQALQQMDSIKECILCYDVVCQFIINFQNRVDRNPYLTIPPGLKLIPAIGVFHLGAHIKECFPKYSLNFIKGAGQLDGEIIETLWWPIDKVAGITRAMTKSHRCEVLDDMMYDSNWKKWVGIAQSLERKHQKAVESIKSMKPAFVELTNYVIKSFGTETYLEWMIQEQKALKDRGDALYIYVAKEAEEPSQGQKRFELQEVEVMSKKSDNSVSWLTEGLNIEEQQSKLRIDLRSAGSKPSIFARSKFTQHRQNLRNRIEKFHKHSRALFGSEVEAEMMTIVAVENDIDLDGPLEDEPDEDLGQEIDDVDEGSATTEIHPEKLVLMLPSSFTSSERAQWSMNLISHQEKELRIGQANDALEQLRNELGQKSLLFRTKVRQAKSQRMKTRAWDDVEKLNVKINKWVGMYRRARTALRKLGVDQDILEKYQEITKDDLKMSKDITEENRFGQRNDKMAWFWCLGNWTFSDSKDSWMTEFYRVNWLRAKARLDRWEEELLLVEKEMEWTTAAFDYQAKLWESRAKMCVDEVRMEGHHAFALREQNCWLRWSSEAKARFKEEKEGKALQKKHKASDLLE